MLKKDGHRKSLGKSLEQGKVILLIVHYGSRGRKYDAVSISNSSKNRGQRYVVGENKGNRAKSAYMG